MSWECSNSDLKAGTIYRQFQAKNRGLITLRAPLWSDLDSFLEFGNSLVSEFEKDPNLGIGHHQKQTRESEALWLSNLLGDVEFERQVSVVASLSDRIIGSGRVSRGRQLDVQHYGELHISVAKEFRDLGLGFQMIQVLLGECKKLGIHIVSLEVFENNPRAIHLYEKLGFKQTGRYPKKVIRDGKFVDTIIMSTEVA